MTRVGWQAYPEYKHSGIEWLGEVPAHWQAMRAKFYTGINMGQSPSSGDCNLDGMGLPFLQGNAEFGPVSPTPRQYCEVAPKAARKGDLLVSVRAPVGALNVADQDYGIGRGLCAITPNTAFLDRQYCWYLLHHVRTQLDLSSTGSTYDAVSTHDVGNLVLLVSPADEQRAIADFLDRETAKIDALIAKKERLIELLQEKRTALISQAVTKGLDSHVPMKDSGIEWLGEIPAHWTTVRIKRLVEVKDGTHETPQYVSPSDDTFPLVTSRHVQGGQIVLYEAKHISREDYRAIIQRSDVASGDVLMPMIGTIGNPAIVGADSAFGIKNVALFKTSEGGLDPRYVAYFIVSALCGAQFDLAARGGVQGFVSLSLLRNLLVLRMPSGEDAHIAEYLDRETGKISKLISKVAQAIGKLREYRTALISAAVTGKIDVREVAP